MPPGWLPGSTPGLIALDIDGTLINWERAEAVDAVDVWNPVEFITPRVVDSVHRAYAAGIPIVLASGRAAHAMTPILDLLDLPYDEANRAWIVASNGAVVVRHPPTEVVHMETFDAREAVRAVLAEHPDAAVAVEDQGLGYRVNKPFPDRELNGRITVQDFDDLFEGPVPRVIIRDPTATAEEFTATVGMLGLQGTEYVVGWSAWLDLAPRGITKASGLGLVAQELGVDPGEVLAIGDGNNDLEMLAWAGRGVAMGQAAPRVLAAADAVTASVVEDGVAVELDRWFG